MASSITTLPAAWPVISMACRMGTPDVMSVPSVREKRAMASLRMISPMPMGMCSLKRSHTCVPRSVRLSRSSPQMAAMIATRITMFMGNESIASEMPIMMRVSNGSLALPRSLYMAAKIGIRNSTMPEKDDDGEAADEDRVDHRRLDRAADAGPPSRAASARRFRTSSRIPPSSPARTMLTYSLLKTLGCFSIASESAMPASTSARTSLITAASFLFGVCSSRTYRQRSIERPELTMVANWREKTVRSLALMRPPIGDLTPPLLDLVEVEHGETAAAQGGGDGGLALALDLPGGLGAAPVERFVREVRHCLSHAPLAAG